MRKAPSKVAQPQVCLRSALYSVRSEGNLCNERLGEALQQKAYFVMSPSINKTVLMSGVQHFGVEELNPYSHKNIQPDLEQAAKEHQAVQEALETAGIKVVKVPDPESCQDAVYTANWALVRGDTAVMSRLPNKRKGEEPYAEQVLRDLGKKIVKVPDDLHFSGQGDALPCGKYLFAGSHYRTDPAAHSFLAQTLGYEVITLQTIPKVGWFGLGRPTINRVTGWLDSFFYDIDLALSVITPGLIAWCPKAFVPESRKILEALPIEKIEVSIEEATKGFACNLVSTGETVIMSARAPKLKAALEAKGLKTITPEITELAKGGGYIRCTTLTLDNE
jgi:N-dimethylarginine dimethylaminohydrolase